MPRRPLALRALPPALALLSPLADALEVGPLQVYSQSGQALVAEVWVAGSALELSDLSARGAAAELYARAQLPYSSVSSHLRLVVERREQERAVLLLRTAEPVPEGKSTLLLDLRWPGGGVIRGYTFALEPNAASAPPPQLETAISAPRSPAPAPRSELPAATAAAEPAAGEYLTRPGDTLGAIARRASTPGVGVDQRMAAIYTLNVQHFSAGNPDHLRSGARLRMPSPEEAARHGEHEARALLLQARGLDAQRDALAREAAASTAMPAPQTRQAQGKIAATVEAPAQASDPGKGQLLIAQRSQGRSRPALVAQLEEQLASQSQQAAERDARLHELEDVVAQLNTLLALQREQAEAARQASAPTAPEADTAQALLSSMPPAAGPRIEGRSGLHLPWHRRPEIQLAVIVFALLSFSALLYTLIEERIASARRRRRRAQRTPMQSSV